MNVCSYLRQVLLVLLISLVAIPAIAVDWPREIPTPNGGKITIYEPQPESLKGNKMTGRAALAVWEKAGAEPIFGAIFFEALLSTSRETRLADLEKLTITQSKMPGLKSEAKLAELVKFLEQEIPKWNLEIDLDLIETSLENQQTDRGAMGFNNAAPEIIYRNKPTTLVLLDGDPIVKNDENLDADRVVNTPYLIFKEGKQWNMYTDGVWYKSSSVTSGWVPNTTLSKKVQAVNTQILEQEKEQHQDDEVASPKATDILVKTKPTELIQTEGDAAYASIPGTSLLYVTNSPNDLFKDINSQKSYVLIAGRWYEASSLTANSWNYIPSDELPADFANIPEGSDKDGVLANVAGTNAAEEALIDNAIPQTARVDRKTAKVEVSYDGTPKFKTIENTSLSLAENSNVTVIRDASGRYFALDNGIWFVSNNANGPWEVANERPKDVENIPATSEAYNTKYVQVYDHTPEYVYVGYTPGYMGSYIYGPTIVYGTGWYYRPWYGSVFYPRPITWGFGFNYNPWTGWSFGFGFNVGFMRFGFGWGGGGYYRPGWGGGWFGPPYYRPPYRPWRPYRPGRPGGWGGGYYGGGNNFVNNGNININIGNNNIYNKHDGVFTKDKRPSYGNGINPSRPAQRPGGNSNGRPSTRPSPGTGGNEAMRPSTRPTPGTNEANRPSTRPAPGPGGNESNRPTTRPAPGPDGNQGNRPTTRPAPGPDGNQGNRPMTRPAPGPGGNEGNRPMTRPAPGPGANESTRPTTREGVYTRDKGPQPTRPSTGTNNIYSDRRGDIYQRNDNGQIQRRDNNSNSWRNVNNNRAASDINRSYQQRNRSTNKSGTYQRSARPSTMQSRPIQSRPSPRPAPRTRTRG